MIALYIVLGVFAAIVLLIVILLNISVKAYIEADKKHLGLDVKYLGFTVFKLHIPDTDKPKEDKPPEKSDSPEFELSEIPEVDSTDDSSAEADGGDKEHADSESKPEKDEDEAKEHDSDKDNEPSLLDKFNTVKKYIPAGKKAFRKLLKLFRFENFAFELTYGSDDPYKTGLNFGRINAVFYNILALLCCLFSVRIDRTDIKCDFEHKTADFYFKTAVYVRPSAVVSLLAYVGVYYLIIKKQVKDKADDKECIRADRKLYEDMHV